MSMLRRKRTIVAMPVMACAVLLIALASPAAAQSEACVHLQVGSGYAATMSVIFGDATIGPSDTFDVGQTQCLSLADVPDGEDFSVVVNAILGDSETCSPANIPRAAALPVAITFNASGTTLNVHRDAPTGATIPEPKPRK
jgi:hypothetical protein